GEFLALTALCAALVSGCGKDSEPEAEQTRPRGVVYTEVREPCSRYNPLRNLYFGDLHAHSELSHDAWIWDIRLKQSYGYGFARGEPVTLPPLDESGAGTRTLSIDRPLDFAAMTEHSEFLAEVRTCTTPGSVAYDAPTCVVFRMKNFLSTILMSYQLAFPVPQRPQDVCGPGLVDCPELAREVWQEVREEADRAYDRTADCSFTTFVGYEYTATTLARNLHRNVFFRNDKVPDLPVSYYEAPTPKALWDGLQSACPEGVAGCEVLVIPHNSNESNGAKFVVEYPGAETLEEERRQAALRSRMEPLAEIVQHKGESECRNGLAGVPGDPDPLCDFEKKRPDAGDCGDVIGLGGVMDLGCVSRWEFVRNALLAGLQEEERLGVNPYKLGIMASTDTHNVSPGAVAEDLYIGHLSLDDDTPEKRLGPSGINNNPGGLTGVWAQENSRDALFEAFRRRETYATSGPRMRVRFFGGWGYPETMCADSRFVSLGYQQGVPMGGDLPPRPAGAASPTFAVRAEMEPDFGARKGVPIQRLQVIKGWIDAQGEPQLKVLDIDGDLDNGASVDPETCQTEGEEFETLCTVFTDTEFAPSQRAFYYVRVLQNPTCRWSTWECNRLPESERPAACNDPAVPKTIQERAWTSPIWYVP
ncbi:MAG: DUF3604 domain-containing protein, partial [Thermodesulfobacteriota bacterium]